MPLIRKGVATLPGLWLACFAAVVAAKPLQSTCVMPTVCETGKECSSLPVPVSLDLVQTGSLATLGQVGSDLVFHLVRMAGTPDTVQALSGTGDQGRAAILLTIWDGGEAEMASLDIGDPNKTPAILLGKCTPVTP